MIHQIPVQNTSQFSSFICDFIASENYVDKNDVSNIILDRNSKLINRSVLTEVLIEQNTTISISSATKKNISLLNNENCFTITTAHQPCFFSGPLYTIYKAISAIKLAEQYKNDFPEKDFVPVYYIGSEDHDLQELNHFYLFNKKIEWQTNQSGAVGSMQISGTESVFVELENLLKNETKKDEVIALLKSFYAQGNTMSLAFRKLMNHFLGKFGLVILDANDKRLKQTFKSIFTDELVNQNSFKLLNDKTWMQNFDDEKLQITPREINLFYLDKNVRERIVFENENYSTKKSSFNLSKNEIENFVEQSTEKLSPNVILRPLYQSTILPDVAFVGGGSEVTYWLQLKTVFDFYKVPFPKIYLRDSAEWIDEASESKRKKWNFSIEEIFADVNFLKNKFLEENGGLQIDHEIEKVNAVILFLQNKINAHDKALEGVSAATIVQIKNQLEQLQKKIVQNDKKKQADTLSQIERWKEKLFPQNHLQERQMNFIELYLKYGESFIEVLYNCFNPEAKTLKVLTP